MSRGRKTGELSVAAAIPPGAPNATSFGPGPSIVQVRRYMYVRRARVVFREEVSSLRSLARPTHIDWVEPVASEVVSAPL